MNILKVQDIRRSFPQPSGAVEILKGISFEASKGEFISMMGPSGSGKSTLLQIIGGLDQATKGSVQVEGQAIQSLSDQALSLLRRRRLGYIFQFFNLVPTLSALENAALPALLDGKSLASAKPRAMELLQWLGVDHRAHNRPAQLSGGEMQRVAIARALFLDPPLILADEPTGNLDSKTGETVLMLLQKAVRERGHTLLMVTHDAKAASYGTRMIRLEDGLLHSDSPISTPHGTLPGNLQ